MEGDALIKLYPIKNTEKVILTARTLPSLIEKSTGRAAISSLTREYVQQGTFQRVREGFFTADFFLKNGVLIAIKPHSAREEREKKPGWRSLILPLDQLLVPAFVDCHLHLALDGRGGFRTLTGPPQPCLLLSRLQTLARAGVLAVRDGGDCYSSSFIAQKMAGSALQKAEPLPLIVATGAALYRRGHYGAKLGGEGLDSLAHLKKELKRRKEAGAQQLKVILSGLVSLQQPGKVGPLQFNLAELHKIVRLANALGLPVMVHASSDAAVRLAVQAGAHSVEHGYFVKEKTLEIMAEKGVAWVPTLAPLAALAGYESRSATGTCEKTADSDQDAVVREQAINMGSPVNPLIRPMLLRIVEEHMQKIARAHERGVTIGVGTDGGAPGVSWSGGYWLELALLFQAGFTPGELLGLATINGAAILGLAQQRGSIAVGKPPYWLCLHMDFINGCIKQNVLKGIIYLEA